MTDRSGKKRFKWLFGGFSGSEGSFLGGGVDNAPPGSHEGGHSRQPSGGGVSGTVAGFLGSISGVGGLSGVQGNSSPAREANTSTGSGGPRLHLNLHSSEGLLLYTAPSGSNSIENSPDASPARNHVHSLSLGASPAESPARAPPSGASYLLPQNSHSGGLPQSTSSRRLSDNADTIPRRQNSTRVVRQPQGLGGMMASGGSTVLSSPHPPVPNRAPQIPTPPLYSPLSYPPVNPYLLPRPDQQQSMIETDPFDRALPPIPAASPPPTSDDFTISPQQNQPVIVDRNDRERSERHSSRRGRTQPPQLPAPLYLSSSGDPNAGLQPPRSRDRRHTTESEPEPVTLRNRFSLPFLSSPTPPESPTSAATASASASGGTSSPRTPQATTMAPTSSPKFPGVSSGSTGPLSPSPKSSAATLTVPGAPPQDSGGASDIAPEKSRSRPLSWLGVGSSNRERSPQTGFRKSLGDLDLAISAIARPFLSGGSAPKPPDETGLTEIGRGRQRARTTSGKMSDGTLRVDESSTRGKSPAETAQPPIASHMLAPLNVARALEIVPVPPPRTPPTRSWRSVAVDKSASGAPVELTAPASIPPMQVPVSPPQEVSPTSPLKTSFDASTTVPVTVPGPAVVSKSSSSADIVLSESPAFKSGYSPDKTVPAMYAMVPAPERESIFRSPIRSSSVRHPNSHMSRPSPADDFVVASKTSVVLQHAEFDVASPNSESLSPTLRKPEGEGGQIANSEADELIRTDTQGVEPLLTASPVTNLPTADSTSDASDHLPPPPLPPKARRRLSSPPNPSVTRSQSTKRFVVESTVEKQLQERADLFVDSKSPDEPYGSLLTSLPLVVEGSRGGVHGDDPSNFASASPARAAESASPASLDQPVIPSTVTESPAPMSVYESGLRPSVMDSPTVPVGGENPVSALGGPPSTPAVFELASPPLVNDVISTISPAQGTSHIFVIDVPPSTPAIESVLSPPSIESGVAVKEMVTPIPMNQAAPEASRQSAESLEMSKDAHDNSSELFEQAVALAPAALLKSSVAQQHVVSAEDSILRDNQEVDRAQSHSALQPVYISVAQSLEDPPACSSSPVEELPVVANDGEPVDSHLVGPDKFGSAASSTNSPGTLSPSPAGATPLAMLPDPVSPKPVEYTDSQSPELDETVTDAADGSASDRGTGGVPATSTSLPVEIETAVIEPESTDIGGQPSVPAKEMEAQDRTPQQTSAEIPVATYSAVPETKPQDLEKQTDPKTMQTDSKGKEREFVERAEVVEVTTSQSAVGFQYSDVDTTVEEQPKPNVSRKVSSSAKHSRKKSDGDKAVSLSLVESSTHSLPADSRHLGLSQPTTASETLKLDDSAAQIAVDVERAPPSPPTRTSARKTPVIPGELMLMDTNDEPRVGSKRRSAIPDGPPRSTTLPDLSKPPRRAASGPGGESSFRPPIESRERGHSRGEGRERGESHREPRERLDAPSRAPPDSESKSHLKSYPRRPSRPGPDGLEASATSATTEKKERERDRAERGERSERSKSQRSEDRDKRSTVSASGSSAAEGGGKYLGHFRIIRSIGEGEFGKVKLGIDARTGQEVAVKLVRKEGLAGAKREKLMREIALLKTALHPHIVKLFDIIETERHVGLVMEYAAGGELFEHILARKMLKESEAKALFRELCGGVTYLHAHGIVHRDLKLENLLLTHDRHLLITDFGFATTVRRAAAEDATQLPPSNERRLLHTSCGSPCYAAPELVLGEGGYDGSTRYLFWSDIVIEMCYPQDDPTSPSSLDISRLYRHIVTTTITFPDHVTAGAREVIRGLLDTEPEDRWSVAKASQHWWVRGEKPKRDRIGGSTATDGPERGGLVAGMINKLEVSDFSSHFETPSQNVPINCLLTRVIITQVSSDKPDKPRPISIPLHPPQLGPILLHGTTTTTNGDQSKTDISQKPPARRGAESHSRESSGGQRTGRESTNLQSEKPHPEGQLPKSEAGNSLPRAHSNLMPGGAAVDSSGTLRRIRSTVGIQDGPSGSSVEGQQTTSNVSAPSAPSLPRHELPGIHGVVSRSSGAEISGMDTLEPPPFKQGGLKVRDMSHQCKSLDIFLNLQPEPMLIKFRTAIASIDSAIDYAAAPSNSSLQLFNQSDLDARRPSNSSIDLTALNRRESRDPSGEDDTDSALSGMSQQKGTPKRLKVLMNEGASDDFPRDKQSGPLFSASRPKRMSIMGAIKNIGSFTTLSVPKVEFRVFNPRQDKSPDSDAIFRTDPEKLLNWIASVIKQPQKGWYETQKIKSLRSEGAGWRVVVWVREGKLPAPPTPTSGGPAKFGMTPSKSTFGINLSGAKSVMAMGSKLNATATSKNPFTRFKSRLMSFTEPERETPIEEEPEHTGPGWVAPPKKEEIRFDAEVLQMGPGVYGVEFRRSHGEVWYFLRLRREILAAVAKLVAEYRGQRIDPLPPPPDRTSKSSTGSYDIDSTVSNRSDPANMTPTAPPPMMPSIPQSVSTPAVSSLTVGSVSSALRSRTQSVETSTMQPAESEIVHGGSSLKPQTGSIRTSIAASIPRFMANRTGRSVSGQPISGLSTSVRPPVETGSLSLASRLARFEGLPSGEETGDAHLRSATGSVRLTGQYGAR
ncbi:hypothetical protein HDU93_002128 [Gonapodya sp. JEL0774]|nr:hypothetical protein HDU93_002128 [Gonapodya sp. JEL0774]